jgi:hypothetical protein
LTDEEKQQLIHASNSYRFGNNDALWMIIAMLEANKWSLGEKLESYRNDFAAIPEQIKEAALAEQKLLESAGQLAASQAEEEISKAVASLVPTIKDEVRRAVKGVVGRVQLGESLFTIYGAIIIVGIFGGVCFVLGNRTYGMLQEQKITHPDFWEQTKWAISSGFIVPALLMSGYLVLKLDDYDWNKLGFVLILFAVGLTAILPLKVMGVLP